MSTPPGPDPSGGGGRPPSEEELRAAYEAELQKLRVEDVVIQTIVSLVNLGGRKAGLAPGTEGERDPEQLRMAIDGARALMPLAEPALGSDAGQIRNALSQLQMAYAQLAGAAPPGEREPSETREEASRHPPSEPGHAEGGGPAQSSGRLWVPGQ